MDYVAAEKIGDYEPWAFEFEFVKISAQNEVYFVFSTHATETFNDDADTFDHKCKVSMSMSNRHMF